MESSEGLTLLTTLLPLAAIVFIITIGVIMLNQHFRKNLYKQLLEKEALEKKYQQELLRSSIEVQELERKRIAHDLHDEIGALLTTSRLYFNQLRPGHAEERLTQISEKINFLFDEMIYNVRRISHDLRPIILENLGIIEAIEDIKNKLIYAGMAFNFQHQLSIVLKKESELLLYRIIQDLIGNTLKHAQAKTISIEITIEKNLLLLRYKDDGVGFNSSKAKFGLGIKSIESRLKLIDGEMKILEADQGVHFLFEVESQNVKQHEQY